jgi:hypothetical protein
MRPLIWQSPVAAAVPFSNAINGFTATESQAAIEEAKNTAPGKARVAITTTFNGTVGANQWLGYNELLPGNQVPILLPFACTLKEVSVTWVGAAVDGQIKFFKNGTTDPTNVIHTQTFTNQSDGGYFTVNQAFAAGDSVRGRWIDQGDNPSDMALVYFFLLD